MPIPGTRNLGSMFSGGQPGDTAENALNLEGGLPGGEEMGGNHRIFAGARQPGNQCLPAGTTRYLPGRRRHNHNHLKNNLNTRRRVHATEFWRFA